MRIHPLALILLLVVAPVVADAQDARAFARAYARGDWAAAALAAERWSRLAPADSEAAYNAACAYALAGDTTAALNWLRRAGTAGFAGVRSVDEDPDLASVRGAAGFAEATIGIRDNRARMFEEFGSQAEASRILTILPPVPVEAPRPLIVVLHGYGGEPTRNAEIFRREAARRGAILAAPSALRPGPGGRGYSWAFRDEAEWWVLRVLEKVAAEHAVDPARIVLAGFSQGANVALEVGLEHPELFAGLLPIAGRFEEHLMPPPGGGGPKVYLLIGSEDSAAWTYRAARRRLGAAGLDVRLRVVQGLGHAYPRRVDHELRIALEYLLPK